MPLPRSCTVSSQGCMEEVDAFDGLETWLDHGFSLEQSVYLNRYFSNYRRRLIGAYAPGRRTTAERLNRKRYAKRITNRRMRRFRRKARPRNLSVQQLLMRRKPSVLLDGLYPARERRWKIATKREPFGVVDLEDFSMIDHPHKTIRSLEALAEAECSLASAQLNFRDQYCHDIGAFLLLEAMWAQLGPIFHGGLIQKPTSKVLEAVGLRAQLGMAPFAEQYGDVLPFKIQKKQRAAGRQTTNPIDPERSEKVSDHLCDWIDLVLDKVANQCLTEEGLVLVQNIAGEALDNAETHGDLQTEEGSWAVAGFMAQRHDRHRFHLSFFNLGATISESVEGCPVVIRDGMNDYVSRHRSVRPDLTEEELRTVYALQDGVTRLERKLSGGAKGGTGLADVLDFFSDLAGGGTDGDQPNLAIVSGSTYIRASPPYDRPLRESVTGITADTILPRQIWFNSRNSPLQPPAESHVFRLPGFVKGTLVTMAFNLNVKYLEESADGHD